MEYSVCTAKKDRYNDNGELVIRAGQRYLAGHEDGRTYLLSDQELTAHEVDEWFDACETFGYSETITTRKGNKVKLYLDHEVDELFFCVERKHEDEYKRMGIDYSPSHPWDAPGMSIRDFI